MSRLPYQFHCDCSVVLFREQTSQQLLQLATELQAVKEERDDALLKLANAQQQADMNAESLRNLQTVLEQFQRGVT